LRLVADRLDREVPVWRREADSQTTHGAKRVPRCLSCESSLRLGC